MIDDSALVLRGYLPEDSAAIWAILEEAHLAGELSSSTRHDLERWHRWIPGDPDGTVIATVDDEIVGLITPRANQLVVRRDHRRKGNGTRLVVAAEELLSRADGGALHLAPPPRDEAAEAFLTSLGYGYHSSLWLLRLPPTVAVPSPVFEPGVTVRSFRPDAPGEIEAWVDVHTASFADHPSPIELTMETARHLLTLPGFAAENLLFATPADDPSLFVGFCRIAIEDVGGERHGHVGILGVRPGWRGHGLGRQLLRWAIESARGRGATDVTLTVEGLNDRALRLYEQTGFDRADEWPRWARPRPE